MLSTRRRGDSDDEGAAPPVNHRNSTALPGMGSSSASNFSANSSEGNRSAPLSRNTTTDAVPSSTSGMQQSAPATLDNYCVTSAVSAATTTGVLEGGGDFYVSRSSSSSFRYKTKSTELPSRWILDPQDRTMMSVTALDRTNFKLNHGPSGDPTVLAVSLLHNSSATSATAASHPDHSNSCLVVSNHSIPLEYLKEVALKNGDQQNGFLDDPSSATGGTIDQILSNLRSKPFGASTTTKRATSASLYPTLPGERSINNARDSITYRNSTGGVNASGFSNSPSHSGRKTTNSPVYYFEITIQALPKDGVVVSVGMVMNDKPSPNPRDNSIIPGEVKNSIGINSIIPGEVKNSIGLTSNGELKVSGRTIDEKKFNLEEFQAGDVIGCGLEVVGTRRVLFTKNGKTIIPPTRFQYVEPKHNAYSPSLGIIMSLTSNHGVTAAAIMAKANFGGKSGLAFRWEESESLHIVNTSVSQLDQKKPPAMASSADKSTRLNGNSSGRMQTEHLEHMSAPPAQVYNFGMPTRGEGLMESNENMPLPSSSAKAATKGMLDDDDDDDSENDPGNYRTGMSIDYQGPQKSRRVGGWNNGPIMNQGLMDVPSQVATASTSAKQPPKSTPPQPRREKESEEALPPPKAKASQPSGKAPARSRTPRGLFNFGKSSKKHDTPSTPDGSSPAEAHESASKTHRKTSSGSNSPVLLGSKLKKKKDGGLLDDDDDDENDVGQTQGNFHKMTASAQDVPSVHKQAQPLGVASAAVSESATAPLSQAPNALFGRKSKAGSLDDDNIGDVDLQNQVSSNISPGKGQASQSAVSGSAGATHLVAQSSAGGANSGAPIIFGKRSKIHSLDDDNPADVELQTAISNSFPDMAQGVAGNNGTANVDAMAAVTRMARVAQAGSDSSSPVIFGKKSAKSSLEDDESENNKLSSRGGTSLSNAYGSARAGNISQPAGGAPNSMSFDAKSRNGSLEDDNPDQNLLQSMAKKEPARSPMMFGSKSTSNSLEDDDPGDVRYQSHGLMTFGFKSTKSSLEDDDPDDDRYTNHSTLTPNFNRESGVPQSGSAVKPIPNAASASRRDIGPGTSQNFPYGVKDTKSSLENEGEPDVRFPIHTTFGAPSTKGSLEGDDPNDTVYENHANIFGTQSKKNSLEDDEPDDFRQQSATQRQYAAVSSMNAYMQASSRQREPVAAANHEPFAASSRRQGQNLRLSEQAIAGFNIAGNMMASSQSAALPSSAALANSPHRPRYNRGSTEVQHPNHRSKRKGPSTESSATLEPRSISAGASSSSSARAQIQGASEDDMLNAAIEESKRDQKKQELKGQIADTGPLKDPEEIEMIRENTRTLRSLCSDDRVEIDASILETYFECCREDQAKVQACLESDDPQVDLEEMIALNELVLDAIEMGEKVIEGSKKKPSTANKRSSKTNLNLDIGALVEKKDIFSLICILRAQSDQRLDAALALMNFAREADSLAEAGTRSLRDEIRSSGGMHSLITVFRSKGASYELRVVSALAVAYVLPSFVESSSVHPSVGLKIMECLRFLSTSRLVSPNGRRISREEMYKAAAMGVTTFWINELTPMLNSSAPKSDSTAERSDLFARTSKKGKRRGRTGGQRHQTLELQELLEMTVSLIVQIERLGETEALIRNHESAKTDSLFLWRYTNVEQVCAVDVARPIAVREGLLPILVGWIRSKDREKVRPAVSALRYLTSIKDKYMAGWIHSQMVNEGALAEVVKLADDYYVGQDVRLAVAQILASLCVAPHTRAAVVEAKCINYLIPFLDDHSDTASQDVALFAGSAILQLAEGAITRASVLGGGDTELQDGATPDKSDTLVDDIVNSGAIGSFIAIAINHEGKLRSMAIEAIRVLSEDTSPNRRTRSQLCEERAAMALGRALKDDVTALHKSMKKPSFRSNESGMDLSLDELHDALCALANILEPIQPGNTPTTNLRFVPSTSDPTQNLIQGCIETAESGGLDSLLWIASLPLTETTMSDSSDFSVQLIDLLEEACRSLASLSPLLLSREPAAQGYARCADSIFEAFDSILMLDSIDGGDGDDSTNSENNYEQEAMLELNISALRGLGALATAEPLKIKIVDKTLPCLLQMRNSQGNGSDVSNVVGQVFLSLGFEEDEIAVQVAGSNPNLLADWFCLQRSLIIQAMARSEIRRMLLHIWRTPFGETKKDCVTRLIREANVRKSTEDKVTVDSFAESFAEVDLFESFTDDDYTEHLRHTMSRQYHEFYNMGAPSRSAFGCDRMNIKRDEVSLLARHMYPLNDTQTEIDWMLSHDESLYSKPKTDSSICTSVLAPGHVEALLDCCFPSRLLRNHVVPIFNLRPEATFNFRALTMPQRRYFSFRREGQLISRLCDKQAESLDFDDVHWTLGFMNSTFAGEFSETFVQALYLCPTIRGLSFGKNEDYSRLRALDGDDESGEDGSAALANLVGSLPPWIQSLTFSKIFNDREVKTLVGIIETMGKLSSDQAAKASSMGGFAARGRDTSSTAQTQGKFWSFAICSSPRVSQEVWHSFFSLLGRVHSLPSKLASSPLSSLKVLDLSFNSLGDETCSFLLELVHDPESGCSLEQLDLSGNGIRKGTKVLSVLHRYVEHHRFNVVSGLQNDLGCWQSSLLTLNLSANNLGVGKAGIELIALLKNNALGLKVLDLSRNGFDPTNIEYELAQVLLSSLEHNTALCHLNLSNNSFSPDVLVGLLSQLSDFDIDCGLAFLGFDNNTPPLTGMQEDYLASFLRKSRRNVLQRCLNERDAAMNRELMHLGSAPLSNPDGLGYQRDLSSIGESTVLKNEESDFTKNDFDDVEEQPGHNMITVLFSAPLVFTNERRQLKPFAKLDFDMERELMWQCMKEASRDIKLFFDNATHDRLLAAITKRCSCLHYSGHGHPSYLPFEDGGGGPNWFKVEDIQRLIAREGAAPFKFVFVSACHSGLAGETFASAGVPHVVCCQQEFELKDTAALAFTRQFYLSLVIGHTVRESFEQGCKAVRATPNLRDSEKEMKKFLLLPKDGNHDIPIFNAKAVMEWPKVNARQSMRKRPSMRPKSITQIRNLHAGGARSSELGVRNMMQEDPSPTPPQFFLGREVEMYYVLKAILNKRLVSVVAEPGLGRSSLVCALCHYINERASTIIAIERIYFVKAKRSRRVDGCRALMEQLLRKLVESGKEDPPDPGVDMEDLFDFICKALKNEKALVVFDRMEYLENSDDAEEFPMLLSTLFRGTKNVKVLVTGRRPLGIPSLGGQVEYPFPLGPLTFENTLRLFANLCPHLHTAGERHKLFERLATDGEQSELRPSDSGINERTKAIFKTIGDGIPSRIEQAAYDISSDNLRDLLDRYGS